MSSAHTLTHHDRERERETRGCWSLPGSGLPDEHVGRGMMATGMFDDVDAGNDEAL